jgi:putative transcriptional antiterminator, bglG
MNCEKLSLNERLNILKMILYFDESGLKLSDIAGTMKIPKADVRKDLEIMSEEVKKDGIKLIYENYKGYKLTGNKGNLLVKRLEIIENIIRELKETGDFFNSEDSGTWHSEEYFYGYIKYENLEITRDFLELIGKELGLEIDEENYNRVFSYILMLINFDELYGNKEELLSRNFLFHTPEYLAVERILGKLFKENDRKESPKEAKLLLITDLIMGINISGLKDDIFYKWINEEAVAEEITDKISDMINLRLREDKILITGLIDNLKFSIYRIKNDIQIINSVFKDLILNKDKNIEIVKKAVEETEKEFKINFTEYELAAMAYLVRASIKRTKRNNIKKVLLICGLGYGSSKILEESLKENYELDIVDVIPYYLADDLIPAYKEVDFILSTIEIHRQFEVSYGIPIIKINPVMQKEDFEKLAEYGIEKNKTSVSLKKLISIIENNTEIKDRQKLIDSLKNEFEDRIINDIQKTGYTLKKLLKKENVKFIDEAENWKEAIFQSGDLLVSNKKVTSEYVQEMIELVEKHGPYIVLEEGIAMPHAGISENVLETGISLLVVNEKVSLPEGRNANIFLSFAAKNKNDNIDIMNDLFELITKYEFIDKVSKMKNYSQLETYLEEIIK